MKPDLKIVFEFGLAVRKILGYIVILTGIVMTFLILKTMFSEA